MNTAELFAQEAVKLPDKHIPYARGGDTLGGMDCQGLMEYCLRQIGIKANWKGSNHMWRDMAWTGTPEECKAKFGRIPVGAWLYIVSDDGGEVARGYKDGKGNAEHVGVYTGQNLGAVHASASRGKVADSKFEGKTIRNGGWNRIGLCKLLDYGEMVVSVEEESETAVEEPRESVGTAFEIPRTIKRGCKGDEVVKLQKILSAIGYTLDLDGIFGPMTEECVKTYQATHELEADGIVGPLTWAELM